MTYFCNYDMPWQGRCKNPVDNFSQNCDEHDHKCVGCGATATRGCPEASSLVCGAPLCDDCHHVYYPADQVKNQPPHSKHEPRCKHNNVVDVGSSKSTIRYTKCLDCKKKVFQ